MEFCTSCYLAIFGLTYAAYIIIPKILLQRKLDRFDASKTPKDVVILHGTKRNSFLPSQSPFVLKLETYLRMVKIPYEHDGDLKNTFGPKGKTPWISLNGEHVADTELCIQFLEKKFGKKLETKYSEKERAIASTVRITLEERMFWEIVMWVFVWGGEGTKAFQRITKAPWLITKYLGYTYKKNSWAQGMGRHSRETIEEWTYKDIRSLSKILGDNKFLLGDQPCTEDASMFGFGAQFIWGFPSTSPYAKLLEDECSNLKAYCLRMKELYYPDWEDCLLKSKSS